MSEAMRVLLFFSSLLAIAVALQLPSCAADLDTSALVGVEKVAVAAHLECPAKIIKVTDGDVQNFASGLLKRAGIAIVQPEKPEFGIPFLRVSMQCLCIPRSNYIAYWIKTEVHEDAKILDRPRATSRLNVLTWGQESFSVLKAPNSKDESLKLFKWPLEQFLGAYREANPKTPITK